VRRDWSATGPVALARVVTEVLSPVPLVSALELLPGWTGEHSREAGLPFGPTAVLIIIVPPYAFVPYGVYRGRFTGHHLGDRRQRLRPILLGMATSVAGIVVLALADAPRLLVAGAATIGTGLLAGAVASPFRKISGHTTAAAAVLVICAGVGHGGPLLAAPLVVGWARVRLKDPTVGQVLAGAAVGALIAGVAMPLLAG
jgi:membrane-associated phospholipid phosphatase